MTNKKSVCYNMKKITLENIKQCLDAIGTEAQKEFEVRVPAEIAQEAQLSIDRMIEYS